MPRKLECLRVVRDNEFGKARDEDYEKALCFFFNRAVTIEEMKFLHDVMKRAAICYARAEEVTIAKSHNVVRFPTR